DVDKVDLIIGAYGTNMLAPAMPVAMQRKKILIGLLGNTVNAAFNYPNYFSMIPTGPDPSPSFTKGFFDVAVRQNPKPKTVAIVAADAEFGLNVSEGARENAKASGLTVVYDRRYHSERPDLARVVRAVAETNPDLVIVCSYPLSARLGRHGAGGQRSRLQAENDRWCHGRPAEHGDQGSARSAAQRLDQLRLLAAGSEDAVRRRGRLDEEVPSARGGRGRGCARLLHAAVGLFPATGPPAGGCSTTRLDSAQLGDYIRANTFKTVVGDVRFGRNGEWARSRMLQVQFQNVKTNDLTQFKDISTQVVAPTEYESGKLIYPYEKALASSP